MCQVHKGEPVTEFIAAGAVFFFAWILGTLGVLLTTLPAVGASIAEQRRQEFPISLLMCLLWIHDGSFVLCSIFVEKKTFSF